VERGPHGVENWEKDPRFQTCNKPVVNWLEKTFGGK
jgi:hypothetical protein